MSPMFNFPALVGSVAVCLIAAGLALRPLFALPSLRRVVQGVYGGLLLALAFAAMTGLATWTPAQAQEPAADAESAADAPAPRASEPPPPRSHDEGDFFAPQAEVDLAERTVIYPENRPAWVDGPRLWEGSRQTSAVCSGPFSTPAEAQRQLQDKITVEVDAYIAEVVGSQLAPPLLRLKLGDIRSQVLPAANRYDEKIEVSIGPMHQAHALLEFGPDLRALIETKWNEVKALSRLAEFGLVGASLLGLLGVFFGYFRLDTLTRGFYTARLQFGAAAAILAVVVVGVWAARWIPWI